MKTSKRFMFILIHILCICIVLVTITLIFVKVGKKLVNTPAIKIALYDGGQNIIFNASDKENLYYSYDVTTGVLNEFTDAENKIFFETKEYIFTRHTSQTCVKVVLESKADKKSKTIFKIQPQAYYKSGKYHYYISDFFEYKTDVYFIFDEFKQRYLYRYDTEKKELLSYNISGEVIGCYENYIVLKSDNSFTKVDMNTKEVSDMFTLTELQTEFAELCKATSNGILIAKRNVQESTVYLELYDFYGNLKSSTQDLKDTYAGLEYASNSIFFDNSKGEIYLPAYFENYTKTGLIKFSSDLSSSVVICEDIAPKKSKSIEKSISEEPYYKQFIVKDSKVYYIALTKQGRFQNDDAFAFCSVEETGEVEVIKSKRKHFLRNFFKSQFR